MGCLCQLLGFKVSIQYLLRAFQRGLKASLGSFGGYGRNVAIGLVGVIVLLYGFGGRFVTIAFTNVGGVVAGL